MKKDHKYKRSHDLISQDLDNLTSEGNASHDECKSYKDYGNRSRKHKRHKHSESHSSKMDYYSHRHSDKIIEIHGSSSEEESSDLEGKGLIRSISRRETEKNWFYERHSGGCKDERRDKSRGKDRLESVSDPEDILRRDKHRMRKKHLCKRKVSDSDSDEYYSNHNRKHRSRESSRENNVRKEEKRIRDRNPERVCEDERRKVKTTSEENDIVKVERDIKKEIKEPKDDRNIKNIKSEPSGSRKRRGSRERDVHEWGGGAGSKNKVSKGSSKEVEKPNFGLSGKLAEDTNMYNGVVIKYSEPPEARMPKKRWRLYPFKGDQDLPTLYIHRQSAYLLGRDRKVVDIPIDHPSCSKQHAALQYRLVTYRRGDGSTGKQIRLYLIDLESANGTFINNKKIEPKKYVELFEKDVIKFGYSSREYVLLHEHSKDDESEDDA